MSTAAPSAPRHDLTYAAQLLEDRQVSKVAIIDDIYDGRSTSELYANEIAEFWAELDLNNVAAKQEFDELMNRSDVKAITRASDIDDSILQLLWHARSEMKELRVPVEQILFPYVIPKVKELESFDEYLRNELNLNVLQLGANVDVQELADVSIVFIDYVLGSPESLQPSVARAENIAGKIYETYSAGDMPLIVLMSNYAGAASDQERFREKSNLIRGMFHFAEKKDLADKGKAALSLASWVKGLPISVDLQRFVKTLEDSAFAVFRDFIGGVRSLSLEDYAYIQFLSLQHEGHPLGDYMLWLYGAYLRHLLFEGHKAMQEQQKIIDGLNRMSLPPNQTMPSGQLSKMYQSALFNLNVGELGIHPAIPANSGGEQTVVPYLHLGDLFIKSSDDEVLLVINAECDLAFGPDRSCDLNSSVLFIRGRLQPPEKWGEPLPQVRTEFFEFESEKYRIIWDVKNVLSLPLRDVNKWLNDRAYKRKARLRLQFALEIQQAFAANLTRVGVPVAPPIYHPVRVEVIAREIEEKAFTLIEAKDDVAFWVLIKTGEIKYQKLFFLTVEFGHLLKAALDSYVSKLTEMKDALSGTLAGTPDQNRVAKKISKLQTRIVALSTFKSDFESWFLELKPSQLEKASESLKLSDLVCLSVERNVDEPFRYAQPILINVIDTHKTTSEESSSNGLSENDTEASQGQQKMVAREVAAEVADRRLDVTVLKQETLSPDSEGELVKRDRQGDAVERSQPTGGDRTAITGVDKNGQEAENE